jgi:Glyoxalase-like domain
VKFVDHVDHVVWVARPENVEASAAQLGALSGIELDGPWVRDDIGLTIYVSWDAGLEIVAPHPEQTAFNQPLHDHLASRGEGMYAIVFGVEDIEAARERARTLGYSPSGLMTEGADAPWAGKHEKLLESYAGTFLDTWFIFGQIDYAPGVVTFQ